jgi:hypothetical protein
MAKESKAAQEAAQEHHGVPDSQWEAEHPPAEALAQEERDIESRLPENTAVADDPLAEQEVARAPGGPPQDAADVAAASAAAPEAGSETVPASGNKAAEVKPESAEAERDRKRDAERDRGKGKS